MKKQLTSLGRLGCFFDSVFCAAGPAPTLHSADIISSFIVRKPMGLTNPPWPCNGARSRIQPSIITQLQTHDSSRFLLCVLSWHLHYLQSCRKGLTDDCPPDTLVPTASSGKHTLPCKVSKMYHFYLHGALEGKIKCSTSKYTTNNYQAKQKEKTEELQQTPKSRK